MSSRQDMWQHRKAGLEVVGGALGLVSGSVALLSRVIGGSTQMVLLALMGNFSLAGGSTLQLVNLCGNFYQKLLRARKGIATFRNVKALLVRSILLDPNLRFRMEFRVSCRLR